MLLPPPFSLNNQAPLFQYDLHALIISTVNLLRGKLMKLAPQLNPKQFWKDHVNHWNKTSLSQASYCQEHELSIKRFGYR